MIFRAWSFRAFRRHNFGLQHPKGKAYGAMIGVPALSGGIGKTPGAGHVADFHGVLLRFAKGIATLKGPSKGGFEYFGFLFHDNTVFQTEIGKQVADAVLG
jgi:hypothetical protein